MGIIAVASLVLVTSTIADVVPTPRPKPCPAPVPPTPPTGLARVGSPPLEWYFTSDTTHTTTVEEGCTVERWDGLDPQGVFGYPWFATVTCPEGATWTAEGWPVDQVVFYLMDGTIAVDSVVHDMTSTAVWIQAGRATKVSITGKAVAIGGEMKFYPGAGAQYVGAPRGLLHGVLSGSRFFLTLTYTSSYSAPSLRVYDPMDAINHLNNATFVHDPHQRDGQEGSNCMDMVWSSLTRVDPPAVTVLACNKSGSYVLDHFHPWGATYIPLAGIACFNTPHQRCIGPGAARWTSPLLRYNESFSVPTDPTSAGCPNPVIMPVTNFDPDHQPEGVPNFKDIPNGMMAIRPPTIATRLLKPPQ